MRGKSIYTIFFKPFFDFFFSIILFIVLSPILLIIAIMVRSKLGSPVLFEQKRPGKGEKIFKMHKFRTMTNERDEQGELLPDDVRLTRFGKALRATSLDELPEIFNILKGEMSFVGPRPQLVKDMVFMTDEQRVRHDIKPGLTGLAQISGRNNVSWEEKIQYDLEYMKKISFFGDLKIVVGTGIQVFKRADVATEGMETAEDYGDYLLREEKITKEEYNERVAEAKSLLNETGGGHGDRK